MLKTNTVSSQVLNKHEFIRLLYSSTQITSELLSQIDNLIQQQSIRELQSETPCLLTLLQDSSPQTFENLSENLIKLISLFERLFDYIQTEKHLQPKIANLIGHLRVHFFYLALTDISLLTDNSHPVRIFFNDMIKVGLLWTEDDPKTRIIEEQLALTISQILKADNSQNIVQRVNQSAKQFNQFVNGLIKKTDIFEKRIKESEQAKATTMSAKLWAKQRITQLVAKQNSANVILSTFSQAWEHLIFLNRIKGNEEELDETQFTVKQLVVSLQPIKNDSDLQKRLELHPILIKKIHEGFDKTPLTFSQTEAFLTELNNHYEQNLQKAQEHSGNQSSEQIIRLKPTSQLDLGINKTKSKDSQLTNLSVDEMSLNQWVEHRYNQLTDLTHGLASKVDDENYAQLTKLEPGEWFELTTSGEVTRAKFACYIVQNDKYLFVNGMGSKVAEFNSRSLEEAFNALQIKHLDSANTFERAYEQLANEVVESHLKQQQEKLRLSQEKAAAEQREKVDKEVKAQLKLKKQQKINQEEAQLAAHQAQIEKYKSEQQIQNITLLPIGSWVDIEVDNNILKCRLAAKIASTGKFIFVDRAGIKVKQCFKQELCELYDTGLLKLKLKNDVFDSALASVITSLRGAKPANK